MAGDDDTTSDGRRVGRRTTLRLLGAGATLAFGGVAGTVGRARALAPGDERWSYETVGGVRASPTVVDGTVYIGSGAATAQDNFVHALDAADGTERWSYETNGPPEPSPTVVGGTVYGGDAAGNLFALDAADGTERWATFTDAQVLSSPTVAGRTLYVGATDGEVLARATSDGSARWSSETGDDVTSSPTVIGGPSTSGARTGPSTPSMRPTAPSDGRSRRPWV
jgi:outer membrane protein assembly factor BamB